MLQALIFDVDGTLADTECAHRAAFNQAFAEEGLDWVWDERMYTELLNISGGKERILHYWKSTRPGMVELAGDSLRDTIARLHEHKTAAYEGMVNEGQVFLRPGVLALINAAHQSGWRWPLPPPLRRSILPRCCARPSARIGAPFSRWSRTRPPHQ